MSDLSKLTLGEFVKEARKFCGRDVDNPQDVLLHQAIRRLSALGEEVPGEWLMDLDGKLHTPNDSCSFNPRCRPVRVFKIKE